MAKSKDKDQQDAGKSDRDYRGNKATGEVQPCHYCGADVNLDDHHERGDGNGRVYCADFEHVNVPAPGTPEARLNDIDTKLGVLIAVIRNSGQNRGGGNRGGRGRDRGRDRDYRD